MTSRHLGVSGAVRLNNGRDEISITADGDSVTVEVPSIRAAFRLVRLIADTGLTRSRTEGFVRTLGVVGLSITLRTPSRRLMSLGGSRAGSGFLRFFGLAGVSFHAR
ncbi:MAG: hypothetical protein AB8G99_27220 [Planctomycetaceae bacterium]